MSRAEERESLKEVAIAMCAIERILAETENDLNSATNKVTCHDQDMFMSHFSVEWERCPRPQHQDLAGSMA